MLRSNPVKEEEIKTIEEHCRWILQNYDVNKPTQSQAIELIKLCSDVESRTAFLYFLLLFVYMPHQTKVKIKMIEGAYKWQKIFAYDVLRYKKFIWKKTRQTASTSMALVYFLWRALFFENQEIPIFSLTARESSDVLKRIEFVYENLPNWLRTPTKESAKTSKTFKNNSRIRSLPSGKNVGRGISASAILLDELAFWDYAETALAAIIPTLSMGLLTPFTNETLPSQMFLVSTFPLEDAGTNQYMRIYREARERQLASDFSDEDFYIVEVDVSDIPEYQDENWHKTMRSTLGDKKYRVEVLGEEPDQFLENSFLRSELLADLSSKVRNPIRCDFIDSQSVDENGIPIHFDKILSMKDKYDPEYGYIRGLWIFADPIPNHYYGIICDVASGGIGGDNSAFHVFDLDTMEQVAEYREKLPLPKYQEVIEKVFLFYGGKLNDQGNCKLCIESTGLGKQLSEYFAEKYPESFFFQKKSKKEYVAGFNLGSNRGNVLATFENCMERNEIKVYSLRTINELKVFGFNSHGKAMAMGKNHDDLVMPLAEFTYLREIFFNSPNAMFLSDDDKEEENEKKGKEHFIFGEKVIIEGDALALYEEGYGIPWELLK